MKRKGCNKDRRRKRNTQKKEALIIDIKMQVNNQMPGGDFNTDELLRQSFLDLDQNNSANNKLFEEASKNIFSKDWPCTISAAKEAQILKPK